MYMSLATMVAQILSFLVFFFILTRYVYPPVSRVLEERRRRVSQLLEAAEADRREAERLRQELAAELEEARRQAHRTLEQASRQAAAESQAMLERAKVEAEHLLRAAREEIEAEKASALAELRAEVAELSVRIAERLLEAEIDEGRHRELIERALAEAGRRA